jgi:hypothetical protein
LKKLLVVCVIVLFLGVAIAPSINANVKQINLSADSILRTQYFQQGQLYHSYESKSTDEEMKQLEKIIVDMDNAFKEKDTWKIKLSITSLKDNHFIDESLYESCLNILDKTVKINNNNIEDKYCLVFAYSNNSLNYYFSEAILGMILYQIYLKITKIGFSGEIFDKLYYLFCNKILPPLVRLLFIKPIAPIIFLSIYDGFVYSLGSNGFGAMNTDDYTIGIGGVIGPFSGVTIDILTPHEEYMYITKFLFVFGISGMVLVDEIVTFP